MGINSRGRPPSDDPRYFTARVRLTDDQRAKLDRAAILRGVTPSAVLRGLVDALDVETPARRADVVAGVGRGA